MLRFRHAAAAALLSLIAAFPAIAQVKQSGLVSPGHAAKWFTTGVIGDAGGAAGGGPGVGLTELGITNTGLPFCINDAPVTLPYHRLCLGANSLGGGLMSYDAVGASPLPLRFSINGALYDFPISLSGILGPDASVVGDAVVWNNTMGTLVKDAGAPPIIEAPTNAALKAIPGGTATQIARVGFYAWGDAPTVLYTWSGSPCSLNVGAGDDGSQVKPDVGTGCWLGSFPGDLDVRNWGARGDGSSDSSAAITAAVTYGMVSADNKTLVFPAGTFLCGTSNTACIKEEGTVVVPVRGAGNGATILRTTASSLPIISVTSTGAGFSVRDIWLDSAGIRAAGTGISLTGGSGVCLPDPLMENITVDNQGTNILLGNTGGWNIINSLILDTAPNGGKEVLYKSEDFPDGCTVGPQSIINSILWSLTLPVGAAGYEHRGGGDTNLTNMRVGGFQRNVWLNQLVGPTGNLNITASDFFEATLNHIAVTQGASGKDFLGLIITASNFADVIYDLSVSAIGIGTGTASAHTKWINNVIIANNNIYNGTLTAPKLIDIGDGDAISITGNTMNGLGGITATGITIGAAASNVSLAGNLGVGLAGLYGAVNAGSLAVYNVPNSVQLAYPGSGCGLSVANGATYPTLAAQGTPCDMTFNVTTARTFFFGSTQGTFGAIQTTGSGTAVNYPVMRGDSATNPAHLEAAGADADINLILKGKGAGVILISKLPTSCSTPITLPAGTVWNNAGVVNVC